MGLIWKTGKKAADVGGGLVLNSETALGFALLIIDLLPSVPLVLYGQPQVSDAA